MKKLILFIMVLWPINVYGISAGAYIVMDTDNNRVIEGSNIHAPYLIASTTKIMTSIVVLNHADIKKEITIGNEVLKSYGSGIYVEVGEKISIENLLYGLMLRSGNDAGIALAFEVGGSMEGFAGMMNEMAKAIGMKNTTFLNAHGLEETKKEGNRASAYDMALLSSYAVQNEDYKRIAGTKSITVKTTHKTYVWTNKNKLLHNYEFCTGGKTGFTELAGRTLVTTATKDNINLTVVTFRDGNDFKDHRDLYEKTFKNYQNYEILKAGEFATKYANTYINNGFKMSLTSKEYEAIKVNVNYEEANATNIVGSVSVSLYDKEYFKENIYKKVEKVKKESFWQKIKRFWSNG